MTFTAIEINPIGKHDLQYGTRYWGRVEEADMSVSFNLMKPVDIMPGAKLEFEERVIKQTGPQSKHPGTDYLFLRKVKVEGQPLPTISRPEATTTATEDITSKLDAIYGEVKVANAMLRRLTGDEAPQKADTVVMDIGDEPISLDDIPF